MEQQTWVLCPVCNNKTRTKILETTELINFPLFCPKCKTETLINMRRQMADSLEDRPFPPLTRKMQEHCFFEFGSTEDHFKYREAVRKAYPDGHFPVFEGHDHMQYQIRDPEGFVRMLETIMETDRLPKLTFAI